MILIVHVVGGRVGGTPFGEVQFELRHRGMLHEVARLLHASDYRLGRGIENSSSIASFVEVALLDSVDVGGNEIHGDVIVSTEADKLLLVVVGHGGCGSSDAAVRALRTDRFRGGSVKLQVIVERAGEEAGKVRLIPNFE